MRILVVEDKRDMNRLIVKTIAKAGYSVDGCFNGEEALEHLLGAEYDAILLDVMMPKLDGFSLLQKLRAEGRDTPVLLLTARDTVSDRVKGLDLGADDYLVKPFDFEELLARIRAMTRKRAGSRSNQFTLADLMVDLERRRGRRRPGLGHGAADRPASRRPHDPGECVGRGQRVYPVPALRRGIKFFGISCKFHIRRLGYHQKPKAERRTYHMKYMKRITILCALALALTACGAQKPTQVAYIGADAAKNLALEASGFSADQVAFSGTDMSTREGLDYYSVVFTADGQAYQYSIDALTGTVIDYAGPPAEMAGEAAAPASGQETSDWFLETFDEAALNPPTTQEGNVESSPEAVQNAAPVQNTPPADRKNVISVEDARAAALAHAGLTKDQVTFVKDGLDWDDGRQTYDLEFYTSDYKEYDYDIDAYTGAVLNFDHDAEYYERPVFSTGSGSITADEAKQKALAQVPGATLDNIREFETDYDDGRLEYEGKIYYDHMEYEFEIDGYSGTIRTWEIESIYD